MFETFFLSTGLLSVSKKQFYCEFGPSALRRRMGVSAVILVAHDVGYGERMQELQREVLILPMQNLYFECTVVQLRRKRRINTHSECYSLLLSLLDSFLLSLKTYVTFSLRISDALSILNTRANFRKISSLFIQSLLLFPKKYQVLSQLYLI